ncbi:MAG: pyrroline-5-carboxylate reductase [Trueperaceae bacterium]|nr:MAG: pyrroline-5-carboxylate reductase [Trueperaceae bacterium]
MKLAIVGAGKMGGAVLTGCLDAGILNPEDVGIYHPKPPRLEALTRKYGVSALDDDTVHHAERVLIAVKPQSFEHVAPLIAGRNTAYISLMAGVSLRNIARRLGSNRVVRAMPNLGASARLSSTALAHLPEATTEDLTAAEQLFDAVGTVHHIPEALFDAFTGLAGSGPAFAAIVAEALADGGVRVGFTRDTAQELAQQVLLATATLLKTKTPAELKNEVASAGGTAIAGVRTLERHRLRFALIDAIEQATSRAVELSKEDR